MFSFSLVYRYFLFLLWFLHWYISCLVAYCLLSTCLCFSLNYWQWIWMMFYYFCALMFPLALLCHRLTTLTVYLPFQRAVSFHNFHISSHYHFFSTISFPLLNIFVKMILSFWTLLGSACLQNFWSLQIWMKPLPGRVLCCRFSSLIVLNISCNSLLTYRVSTEKSADSLMGVLL